MTLEVLGFLKLGWQAERKIGRRDLIGWRLGLTSVYKWLFQTQTSRGSMVHVLWSCTQGMHVCIRNHGALCEGAVY